MLEGRATGTCNLGPLIRADVAAADSLQGTGLIKWRGSCELLGVFSPAMGTVVTFAYTVQGQANVSIPKTFRVLSSFADPLANNGEGQTTIELGCLLTFMEDAAEPTELNPRDDDDLGNDEQQDEDFDAIGASISASYIFRQCATAIDITYSFNDGPLTSTFRLDTVNLEQGYVTVMSDLLVSESMVGELDANEVLQIRKMEEGGTESGKLINTTNIISIAPLNAGQLPGENVAVQYSSWSLKDPDDDDGFFSPWEKVTTVGPEVKQAIGEFPGFPTTANTITYTPSSETTTYYRELVIDGQTRSVTDRVETVTTTVLSELIPEYYAAVFAVFRDVSVYPNPSVNSYTVTTYEYNAEGDVTREESVTTEDKFALFGRMNIRLGYSRESIDPAQLLGELIETSKTVTTYQYTETKRQVVTTDYVHYSMTQEGQQLAAEIGTFLYTAEKLLVMLQRLGLQGLVNQGSRVQTTLKPSEPENVVPGPTERLNVGGQDDPLERTTETVWVYGDQESIRRTVFRMPYAPDDLVTGTSGNYTVVKSDAEAKARLYGRIQNKLLFGARYGLSLQVSPVKMPSMAFDPLNVDLAGVMGQFRLNNLSYVIEPGEVVCGCNALFWGVIGSTPFTGSGGGQWLPLPPGVDVGDLPPAPSPLDDDDLGQVVPVPPGTVLPPYTIRERYALAAYWGRFSLSGKAADSRKSFAWTITAARRVFAVTGRAATAQRNVPMAADAGTYALTGRDATTVRDTPVAADRGTFALTGRDATLVGPPTDYPLTADRGTFTVTGSPVSLVGADDADAIAYIAAIESEDGQQLEFGVQAAYNRFVKGCKSDSIWTAIEAACIMAGARTRAGALVPLKGTAPTQHGTSGGWSYNRETGLQANGTDNYLNSQRAQNADGQDSCHLAVYVSTAHTTGAGSFRAYAAAATPVSPFIGTHIQRDENNGQLYTRVNSGTVTFFGSGSQTGFIGVSRASSAAHDLRHEGATTSQSTTSAAPIASNTFVFANNVGGSPYANSFSNSRIAFYSIGSSINLAQLDSRVSTLITDLAAAIP